MTPEILEAVNKLSATTSEQLKSLSAQGRESELRIDALAQSLAGGEHFTPSARKSVMDSVIKSAQLDALRNRTAKSALIPLQNVSMKALVNDNSATNQHFDTQAQRHPAITADNRRKLRLLDLLTVLPISSGSFEFQPLLGSNGADYQIGQGDTKSENESTFGMETVQICTIAVHEPASEQVLSDSPVLAHFLESRLKYNVLNKFEREVVGGVGGTGKITGLVSKATAYTPTATETVDIVGEAQAVLDDAGWQADIVIMSPIRWNALRTQKGTDGQYISGSWSDPQGNPNMWSLPVITSSSLDNDTILVGDTQHLVILDREQPSFSFNYTGDGFIQNILTGRAELRGSVAVLAPASLLKITIA